MACRNWLKNCICKAAHNLLLLRVCLSYICMEEIIIINKVKQIHVSYNDKRGDAINIERHTHTHI